MSDPLYCYAPERLSWKASREAHFGQYTVMATCIAAAIRDRPDRR